MPQHRKPNGEIVTYEIPAHLNAGNQKVSLATIHNGKNKGKSDKSGDGEHYLRQSMGTWRNYGGHGVGASRDPNTGRQVMFQRVEGKVKGVVKVNGCVQYGS